MSDTSPTIPVFLASVMIGAGKGFLHIVNPAVYEKVDDLMARANAADVHMLISDKAEHMHLLIGREDRKDGVVRFFQKGRSYGVEMIPLNDGDVVHMTRMEPRGDASEPFAVQGSLYRIYLVEGVYSALPETGVYFGLDLQSVPEIVRGADLSAQ